MLFVAQWILISILVTRLEPLPVILAHLHRQATCQGKGSKPGGT